MDRLTTLFELFFFLFSESKPTGVGAVFPPRPGPGAGAFAAHIYTWLVRAYPQAGVDLDLLQIALWALFFGFTSFFLTAGYTFY